MRLHLSPNCCLVSSTMAPPGSVLRCAAPPAALPPAATGSVLGAAASSAATPPAAPPRLVSSTTAPPGSVLGCTAPPAALPPAATGSVLGYAASSAAHPTAAPGSVLRCAASPAALPPAAPPPAALDVTLDVHAPILWRSPFPPHIQAALVSWENPTGTVSNSDLELAASVAHNDVLVNAFDLRERTIHTGSDNTPTVYWQRKGSTTSAKAPARLLRLQALHQRHHRYCPLWSHLPGPVNAMADDTSRLWNLTDDELLTHFNLVYPQPLPWRLCHLRPAMKSALISACSGQPSTPESFLHAPEPTAKHGSAGVPSVLPSAPMKPLPTSQTQSSFSRSSPSATVTVAQLPAANQFALAQWRTPSVRWARASPDWGPQTPASTPSAPSTSASNASSGATPAPILPLTASNPSRSLLSSTSSPPPPPLGPSTTSP